MYSIHRVQHTPSTASTQDCSSSLHSHDYQLTPECYLSFGRTSLHNRPPSGICPWELKGKVILSISNGCELTNWWKESDYLVRCPLTAPMYSSTLTQSWPPSASPNSLDYCLQVRMSMASKSISKLPRSRSRSASLCSIDDYLQVYLQTRSIAAPNCISKLARLQPASSHEVGLHVHLQTRLITISECISKFTRSWPPSSSPITLDYPVQVHQHTRSITAAEYFSEFTRSSFSGAPRIVLKHRLQPVQIYRV